MSFTTICNNEFPGPLTTARAISPWSGVNLKALDNKLYSIFSTLSASKRHIRGDGGSDRSNRMPRKVASEEKEAYTTLTNSDRSPSSIVRVILPDSSFERSSNWLIRRSRRRALRYITCNCGNSEGCTPACCCFTWEIRSSRLFSINVRGVRNSWEILAKKRDLASSSFFNFSVCAASCSDCLASWLLDTVNCSDWFSNWRFLLAISSLFSTSKRFLLILSRNWLITKTAISIAPNRPATIVFLMNSCCFLSFSSSWISACFFSSS